jgi:hypothetical protein
MSKGQILSYKHLILHSRDNLTPYFLLKPYLGGGVGTSYADFSFPPILRAGFGWECGWLGPPSSFVLANAQVGAGGKGQPLQMTNLLSYVLSLCSQDLSSPTLIYT